MTIKHIIDKFLADLDKNVISVLIEKRLLPKKFLLGFKEMEIFLKDDQKNIFSMLDFLASSYLYQDGSVNDLPKIILDFISDMISDIMSDSKGLNTECQVQKIIIKYVICKIRQLFINIFNDYHNVKINIWKKNNKEQNLLALLLVEHLYRHDFVKLPVLNKNSITECVKSKKIGNKNISGLVLKYATSIQKK